MPSDSTKSTAVVVGATGIVGRAIVAKLAGLGGWRVLGVTRSGGTAPGVDETIAADLRDPDEARRRLAPAAGATHLFFAAYLPQASWAAEVAPNLAAIKPGPVRQRSPEIPTDASCHPSMAFNARRSASYSSQHSAQIER
jgi:NAD(P)-dependent dehydrogenase (short-subunit alcohol dehydrogenase family)